MLQNLAIPLNSFSSYDGINTTFMYLHVVFFVIVASQTAPRLVGQFHKFLVRQWKKEGKGETEREKKVNL